MINKRKTILLGIKNNEIITADLMLTNRNGYQEFSTSFNCGVAFDINSIDDSYKRDYYESLWDCYDPQSKLDLLWDGDRTKQDVIKKWDCDDDYRNIIDCSCTDYEIDIDDITINFDTNGCGQYDVRDDTDFKDMIFTDEELFKKIMYYWDNFHLKKVNEEQVNEILELMDSKYAEYSDDFYDFIENNIDVEVL